MQEALEGKYVMPGPGGDPIRNPKVLPTGKNMHALDPQSIPTAAAVKGAKVVVDRLLEREYQVNGNVWPESIALVLWGTDNIKTYGESLAQARSCHTAFAMACRSVDFILRLSSASRLRATGLTAACRVVNASHATVYTSCASWCRSTTCLAWLLDSRCLIPTAALQVLWMVGVKPVPDALGRVNKLEVLSLEELGRPRIDVVVNCSGVFRDLFVNQMNLLDRAVKMVAELDEPVAQNYVRKHALEQVRAMPPFCDLPCGCCRALSNSASCSVRCNQMVLFVCYFVPQTHASVLSCQPMLLYLT